MRIPLVLVAFLLLAVALAAYAPCFGGSYIWDDHLLVKENSVSTGDALWTRAFSQEMYEGGMHTNYYRPMVLLSYRSQRLGRTLDPLALHVFNVVLHAAVGFLIFCLLRRLAGDDFGGMAAALLFVLHPIHTEAVAYISGRADPLFALFSLGSLLCLVERERSLGRLALSRGLYALSLFLFAVALLSKEAAFIFPVALWVLRGRARNTLRSFALWPFFLILLVYFLARQTWLNFSGLTFVWEKKSIALATVGPFFRVSMLLKSMALYAGDLVFPFDLHLVRRLLEERVGLLHVAGSCVLVAMLAAAWRRARLFASCALLWFFAWFLPQSPLVFPHIRSDHFLYLASVGLFFLVGLSWGRRPSRALILAGLALYFGMSTFVHAGTWRNEQDFFARLHRLVPWSVDVAGQLVELHLRRGADDEALEVCLRQIEHQAGPGALAGFCSRCERAVLSLEPASLQDKRHAFARLFYNTGILWERFGSPEDALCAYRSAQSCDPLMPEILNNMGLLLWKQGDTEEARRLFQEAVRVDPRFVSGWNNMAALIASQGHMEEAWSHLSEALRLKPDHPSALNNKKAWFALKNS